MRGEHVRGILKRQVRTAVRVILHTEMMVVSPVVFSLGL